MVLTGSGNIDGTVNELANVMSGNAGNNVLDGGTGADVMNGGAGDDTFIVDNAGDIVHEAAGEGTDTVEASVSYSISIGYQADIENLTLTGTAAINGTGNGLGNTITGNDAQNVLNGRGGDDVLDGKVGNDILVGGDGADTFVFSSAFGSHNVDTIQDFVSGTDHFELSSSVFTALPGSSTLDPSAFHAGASAQDADDHIVYDATTGNIYYDADGNGAAAQILFAHITPGSALTNADFHIG